MQSNNSVYLNRPNNYESSDTIHVDELTLNWHITEACNYHCQYCYAHWQDRPNPRELFHNKNDTYNLLWQLMTFFHPDNQDNPLRSKMDWKSVRLNIAGGEPSILSGHLQEIINLAKFIGFNVSIITNGSNLSKEAMMVLAPSLSCLGISLDSFNSVTNRAIGRSDRKGNQIDTDELIHSIKLARIINPKITIKLNTVVNRHNWIEDLSDLIQQIKPDRWKLLRVLPIINDSLAISDEQFSTFIERHHKFRSIQCIENNQDMRESYLMIDPFGRFFQNSTYIVGSGYVYSQPILSSGAELAFSEMSFNAQGFKSRYSSDTVGGYLS